MRTSWLTGAAAWAYFCPSQYILGLRPEIDDLRIDPCIPSIWSGFSAIRRFRTHIYRIVVYNPDHVCHGVVRMTVNGHEISDYLILTGMDGEEQLVEVWLGEK